MAAAKATQEADDVVVAQQQMQSTQEALIQVKPENQRIYMCSLT